MNKGHPVTRATNKLKREMLRLPGVRVLRGFSHYEALEAHSTKLPPLDPRDLPILEGLRHEGTFKAPVESLGLARTPELLAALETLVAELRVLPASGGNAPRLPLTRVYEFPVVFLWGLDERLLALVENYIGLPVQYHGADFRREICDSVTNDVRQWHIDNEDHRMFKVIMYLNDVETGGGPFNYIPREQTLEAVRKLRYGSGFVKDEALERAVPKAGWLEATARARTAVFADTCRVFHRAQPPSLRDRYSVTFSWTSRTPVKTYPTIPLTEDARAYILGQTNARQQACLAPRRA
jgi:hypothetical protein